MTSELKHEARQMITYLQFDSARVKLGDVVATTEAMILTIRLNSFTPIEAAASIRQQLDGLKARLAE